AKTETPAAVTIAPLPAGDFPAGPIAPLAALAPSPAIDPRPPADVRAESVDWAGLLAATAVGLWLLGAVSVCGWTLVRLIRFQRLLRHALPAPGAILMEAARLSEALGVSCPRVVLLPGAISPLLWVAGR